MTINEYSKRGRPVDVSARQDRKQQILAGARICFVKSGFHGASMSEISVAAKVSAANIYQYYSGKEALILALVEDALRQDLEIAHSLAGGDLSAKTMREVLGHFFLTEEGHHIAQMRVGVLSEATRNPQINHLVRRCEEHFLFAVETSILAQQNKDIIPKSISASKAAYEIALLHDGLINRFILDAGKGYEILERLISEIQRILCISN